MKTSTKSLRRAMEHACSYEEWRLAAQELDRTTGLDDWREDDASPHYDYPLIRFRLNELREARQREDVNQLIFNLHEGLHGNLGNIANPALYTVASFGTKRLICDYLDEVSACLVYLCDNEFEQFPFAEKLEFFKSSGRAFGRSALMLSGGAALGLFHLGVIKALWEERLLPEVISGSSAGSIIVSALGAHTDDEIDGLLEPSYLYTEAFKVIGWRGVFKGRPLLDGDHLESCLEQNVPDMTFAEAFEHTGRLINIPVSPYDTHQQSRLLNARTSPHVLIRKAALASCAIPGVFPAVTLWAKNVHGEKVPYIPSRKWVDGSIKDDLPVQRLARLYGVNHTIVSQTNPHVAPFLSRDGDGHTLSRFIKDLAVKNARMNLHMVLDVLRRNVPNDELALLLDKAQSVMTQQYSGDINIVPPMFVRNFLRIVKNPNAADMQYFIESGAKSTWPKIEFIRRTTQISRTFSACICKLKKQENKRLRNPKLSLVG